MEENGHIDFHVAPSVPPVSLMDGIELYYSDTDGTRVDLIVSFVDNRLSWIDRYRITGGDPEIKIPAVGRARLYGINPGRRSEPPSP